MITGLILKFSFFAAIFFMMFKMVFDFFMIGLSVFVLSRFKKREEPIMKQARARRVN